MHSKKKKKLEILTVLKLLKTTAQRSSKTNFLIFNKLSIFSVITDSTVRKVPLSLCKVF